MYINHKSFRQWWDVFHNEDNPMTEIRLIGKGISGRNITSSAYFDDCETALNAISDYPAEMGAYAPMNKIRQSCLGREQRGHFIDSCKNTTSGVDIEGRLWILIDFDPRRASDTNSTDEEKEEAWKVLKKVGTFLRDNGFSAPIVVDSSNGYHLYYRVKLANDDANKNLVSSFLEVLDTFFSNEYCEIDRAVRDSNRIAKVVGTKSAKGADTEDRPRRESKFLRVPDFIEVTDKAFIEKVANMLPKKEVPSRFNGYSSDAFDIEDFIRKHGIVVEKRTRFGGGERLVLESCPFDSNHKSPDSAIFIMDNGAIGFKCLHNSCSSYTWRDVRLHFEPDAYSKRDYADFQRRRDYFSSEMKPAPIVIEESEEKGAKWLKMQSIEWADPSKLTYIPTGFFGIDNNIGGLALGDVTIISGIAGSGKTSILNNIILSTIQHGYKVAIWSGELTPYRFKSWFNQAAAGANFVIRGAGETEYYYCPKDVSEKIDKWTNDRIYLYNNNYGNKASQILQDVRDCVRDNGTQLLVFDNKMAMALDSYTGDKNERDAGLINELKDFAQQSKLHIILVCHPRKEQGNSLLRMESIAGNSDLYNCASNVFLCHRVGRDFERRATEFFGKERVAELTNANYGEVVEIAKNRSHGRCDVVFGLYWENKTRRFVNEIGEYVVYNWQSGYKPPVETINETPKDTFVPNTFWWQDAENDEDLPDFK